MVNENIPAIFSQYQEKSNKEIEPVKKEKRKLKIDKNNKKNSNKNNNSGSKLSISPSLSSLLNQRKSQKLNNNSKKATHHYHKYEKYSSDNDNSSDDSMDSIKKNCIKRRRSSSYWYNTNINNSNSSNKFIHNSNDFFDNSFIEEDNNDDEGKGENSFDPLTTTNPFDNNVYSDETKVIVETYSFSNETDATITCKIFSDLSDLDLITEYSLNDIDEFFAPKFDINSKRSHYNNRRQTCFADIELDSIAESLEEDNDNERELKKKENIIRKDIATMKNAVISSSVLPEMNKEIMQPHFMRLYAFEQNSKFKGSLPDLDIDESLLSKLSYKDIWTLEVPTATKEKETNGNNNNNNACLKSITEELKIKLALMTRKKLWCDMIVQVSKRQQPIDKKELLMITKNSEELVNSNISKNNNNNTNNNKNKNSENNNLIALNAHQFAHIGYEHNNNDNKNNRIKTTSLLRLKDGPLPWNTKAKSDLFNKGMTIKNTSFMNDNVIKPFGVLPNSKKTQYVVKGWVDKRFF
ncbi:hypothetical protein ACO0SA_004263 [Hanseniaspora valbyensis]